MTSQARLISPGVLALAGTLCLAAAMGIGRFAFTPVLPLMLGEGVLDIAQAGWLATANYAGYLAGALSAARVPMRAGPMAVLALLATAALTGAMALPLPAIWLPLRFLAGAASAWVFVSTSVWCLSALAQQGGSRANGWVYAGVGIGIAVVGLYCMLAIEVRVSSASLWLQLGGLALLLALPGFCVIARLPPSTHAAPLPIVGKASQAAGGDTRGLVVCYGVMGFGYILPATYLPVLARTVVSDPRVFGLAWPVFGAMAALSTLIAAKRLQGETRRKTWATCQLLMGLGALLPALWVNLWTILLSALLVGGTFMVITLAGVQEMRARAPAHAARLVGKITAAFALGQIAGPIASTLLLHAGPQGLSITLAVGSAALFATGAWLWRTASQQTPLDVVFHG